MACADRAAHPARVAMTLRTDEITNILSDVGFDMRLRQAIVVTAVLRPGPM